MQVYPGKSILSCPRGRKSLGIMEFFFNPFIYQIHTKFSPLGCSVQSVGKQWWENQTWSQPLRSFDLVQWTLLTTQVLDEDVEGKVGSCYDNNPIELELSRHFPLSMPTSLISPKLINQIAVPVYSLTSRIQSVPLVQVNNWYFPTLRLSTAGWISWLNLHFFDG